MTEQDIKLILDLHNAIAVKFLNRIERYNSIYNSSKIIKNAVEYTLENGDWLVITIRWRCNEDFSYKQEYSLTELKSRINLDIDDLANQYLNRCWLYHF